MGERGLCSVEHHTELCWVKTVIIAPNEMVVVFCQNDKQIPALQGPFQRVWPRLRHAMRPETVIEDMRADGAAFWQAEHTRATALTYLPHELP